MCPKIYKEKYKDLARSKTVVAIGEIGVLIRGKGWRSLGEDLHSFPFGRLMHRKLSWLLAVFAYLGPPVWACFAVLADNRDQMNAYGFMKCGNNVGIIISCACILSGSSSLVAGCLGAVSLQAVPRPPLRSSSRERC